MFSTASRRLAPKFVGLVVCAQFVSSVSNQPNCQDSKSHEQGSDVSHRKVLVIGGGTGGVGVAALLRRDGVNQVAIVEPCNKHYYQPLWTLVGGGLKPVEKSVRPMEEMVRDTEWIKGAVKSFSPERNEVTLESGQVLSYDYLVVAAGMQLDWDKVSGLKEALDDPNSKVVSIYDPVYAKKTWEKIQAFTQGRAIFIMPPTLLKCAGAPQKIMWLFEDRLRERGLRSASQVEYWVPGEAMFGVKKYADQLNEIRMQRDVVFQPKRQLVSVDGSRSVATFKNLQNGAESREQFDLLHAVPPMSAPDFIKRSPLADAAGWLAVDKYTLQSTKYSNIFGLGDCTSTPNSKTAAAITRQLPVLVHNLEQQMAGKPLTAKYDGYASCPLVINKNEVLLAEFGYDGKIMETFSPETGKFPYSLLGQDKKVSRQFFMHLKKDVFPFVYWHLWPRGHWFGSSAVIRPTFPNEEKDPSSSPSSAK